MTRIVILPAASDADLAALARKLAALPDLLFPLDVPGCDGEACHRPAFRDHSTDLWRHVADLSRCRSDRQDPSHLHREQRTG